MQRDAHPAGSFPDAPFLPAAPRRTAAAAPPALAKLLSVAALALALSPAAAQSAGGGDSSGGSEAALSGRGAPGESPSLATGGSVLGQAYANYAGSLAPQAGDFGYGSSTRLGLTLDAKGSRARASASLEAAVLDGAAAQAAWLLIEAGAVPTDELFVPAQRPAGGPDLIAAARVRTLYVKYDADWASFTAGRQVINYERGALWSPTDIFTELDLTGLSPERLGSDALRLELPLGATGGLDLAAAPATVLAQGLYAARLSGLVLGVDSALAAARDGAAETSSVGADCKFDLGASFYGDALYSLPDSGAAGIWRAAAGGDWGTGDFILAAEYYYNGGGAAADPLFPDAQNLYGSLTWRASEFVSVSAVGIWDPIGESGSATLLGSISAAQNASLSLFGKAAWGASSTAALGQSGAALIAQAGAALEIFF
ncbi:MAG TPA: hypothetical protein VMV90_10910 [Rectinemataceae bacterium]|nr:hypothetical protein [Rectinemataceae bacterium]